MALNTQKLHKLGKGEENHVCWAYIADGDFSLEGQRLHTKLTAATNFQADQNKPESKTILTAEKCGNVLRGNYSPFPLVSPAFLLSLVHVLNYSCHSVKRPVCTEGIVQGVLGPGMLPASLAAWGPMSTDKDISPMSDA